MPEPPSAPTPDELNKLASRILDCATEVHRHWGPGMLEGLYEDALTVELEMAGIPYERQKRVPVIYKGRTLSRPMALDLLVGGQIIIETKAVEKHNPVFESQTLSYLRLTGLHLGYVLNFGMPLMKSGIHRVVNNFPDL